MLQTRRSFLMSFLSSAALPVLCTGPAGAQGFPQRLTLTPQCGDDDELTLAQDEGPFFKPNAPLRHDLTTDVRGGNRIMIAGFVMDKHCRPIPGSLLEIWHADGVGDMTMLGSGFVAISRRITKVVGGSTRSFQPPILGVPGTITSRCRGSAARSSRLSSTSLASHSINETGCSISDSCYM